MEQDEILKKIEEIYNSTNKEGKPVGKGFISHLIRSYTPVDKIQKIWESANKNLKCAITGHVLCTIEDAFQALNSEGMDKKLLEHLQKSVRGESGIEHPMREELKGKVIGYTGDKTDTALCLDAVQAFICWIQNKILGGDKNISWIINDMRKKETIKVIREKLPEAEDQKKIDRIEKLSKKPQRSTTSLGDFVILKEIQEKLKSQEESDKK